MLIKHVLAKRINAVVLPYVSTTTRSQLSRGLRRGSVAACLLGLWVRIPLRAWMSVSCECCGMSGRCLRVGLVTRSEESYRVWCVYLSVIVKPW